MLKDLTLSNFDLVWFYWHIFSASRPDQDQVLLAARCMGLK
uniref:Uncharacterized protein n=1 Tax=Peronospora matthiolae TaxID=2874970 RepID=A0AAV1TRM3_9STRA